MPHEVGYSYVGYEDIFPTSEAPADGIEFYFRHVPRSWLIETLGKIGTTLFNMQSYMLNVNQQIAFVESFRREVSYTERIVRFLATHPTRVFAHTNLITALTRYALLYGNPNGHTPPFAYDHLLRSITLLSSFYGRTRFVGRRDREAFLPYEMEIMMSMKFNFSFMMARYYRFMAWGASQSPSSKYYLPIHADFPEFFAGSTYYEYAAAAIVIANPFTTPLNLAEWQRQRGIVNMHEWTAPLRSTTAIAAQLEALSIDMAGAIEQLSQRPNHYGLTDIRPFITHPLLRLHGDVFACPHQGFLRNKLGEGIYWGFFNGYAARDGERVSIRFSQFFGRFLEDYVFGLIRDGSNERAEVKVFPEHRYTTRLGGVDAPDVAFFAGNVAVFFEVTRKRLPLDEGICDQRPEAISSTIEQLFVRKARQLHNRIAEFRAGILRYDGVAASSIDRIFPVIVTEQDFPQLIALPTMIRDAIGNAGLLGDCEVLQIMSAEDVELLHLDARGALDLEGILSRKAALPAYINRDLVAYLYDHERARLNHDPNVSLPGYAQFAERTREIVHRWGLEGL